MNRGVRTVQRWHITHGLPIYRVGGDKGSVYAFADELEQWLAGGTAAAETRPETSESVIELQKRRSIQAERLASALWEVRSEENLQAMLALYRRAIDQYPDNIAGVAGLANCLIFGGLIGQIDLRLAYPSIKAALKQAQQKDAQDLNVQSAVAWTKLLYECEWKQAMRRFSEILRLNPVFGPALFGAAILHLAAGNVNEATHFAWASWSAEPMGSCQAGLAAICMVYAGAMPDAARLTKQVELTGASCGTIAIAEAMVAIHTMRPSEGVMVVRSFYERHPRSDVLRGLLGYAYAAVGEAKRAEQLLGELEANDNSSDSWYAKSLLLSGLGQTREAVDAIKQSADVLSLWRLGLRTDPLLAPLKDDPEFQGLLAKCLPAGSETFGRDGRAA